MLMGKSAVGARINKGDLQKASRSCPSHEATRKGRSEKLRKERNNLYI